MTSKRTILSIATAMLIAAIALSSVFLFEPLVTATATNTVTASANVVGTCYISLSSNTINFGNILPNANVPTNMLITDYDNGGNVAANILISGTNWTYSSYSFGVSNTLWSASMQSTYTGTALTLTPTLTSTGIVIPTPTQTSTTTSNNIYFGLAIPAGTPAGVYTQTITIENSC
ncbi:MAG: hypothetical protein ACP5RQ_01395 [Candidatus Micrarchaeia archaeon]